MPAPPPRDRGGRCLSTSRRAPRGNRRCAASPATCPGRTSISAVSRAHLGGGLGHISRLVVMRREVARYKSERRRAIRQRHHEAALVAADTADARRRARRLARVGRGVGRHVGRPYLGYISPAASRHHRPSRPSQRPTVASTKGTRARVRPSRCRAGRVASSPTTTPVVRVRGYFRLRIRRGRARELLRPRRRPYRVGARAVFDTSRRVWGGNMYRFRAFSPNLPRRLSPGGPRLRFLPRSRCSTLLHEHG